QMEEIGGTYVLLALNRSFMQPVQTMGYTTIAISVVSILITAMCIIVFVQTLTKPLQKLRESMKKVREGNLRKIEPPKTTLPELVSLHKSFDAMIRQMRQLLSEVIDTTAELTHTGIKLQNSSDDALQSSKDLFTSIDIVKKGAEQTSSNSEDSKDLFMNMTVNVETMIHNLNDVFRNSESMKTSAVDGE